MFNVPLLNFANEMWLALSKVMEISIPYHLIKYMQLHELLSDRQYGFLYSTGDFRFINL